MNWRAKRVYELGLAVGVVILGLAAQPAMAQELEGHEHLREREHQASSSMGVAHTRQGSGTAWLPDSSPMDAIALTMSGWRIMLHGMIAVGVDAQGTDRGGSELISTNWLMAMASRPLLGGDAMLRTMVSAEPSTVGADGYPLLLQTGESYQGEPLVDRQHPHDLFMELAAGYTRPVAGGLAIELYGGPVGEPALGPAAFPHRVSSMRDPLAPLSHHWLDSTHITFGAVTGGLFNQWAKLEASWFNGREPDEERHDFDLRGFDSYSARLSINPLYDVSAQVSYGFLESPEELEPEESVHRTTASLIYNQRVGTRGNWATTAAWGRNTPSGDESATDAFLLENALDTGHSGTFFARLEQVEKEGRELGISPALADSTFIIHGLSVGALYELRPVAFFRPGIGIRAHVVHLVDEELEPYYGTHLPAGVMAFVSLRPASMEGSGSHPH
jgi:hypothetical protein